MIKNLLYFFKIIILSFFCSQAFAQEDLLKNHQKDLKIIENYVNNIKTLEASFIQETSNNEVSAGKFWLSRPGKMRLEYDYPAPLLIVVNGNVLSYVDVELDETSYLTTNSTPASFLTRKNFSFSAKDVELTGFNKKDGLISVSLMKKNKKEAGEFTLVFASKPLKFVQMNVKNDLDETIKVSLNNIQFGNKLNRRLFIVKNKNLPQ